MGSTWKRVAAGSAVALALGGLGVGVGNAVTAAPATLGAPDVSTAMRGGGMHGMPSPVDYWFAVNMAEHHEDAVAMADLAVKSSPRSEVRKLAADISRSQTAEIAQLRAAAERLGPGGGRGGMHGGGMQGGGMHGGGMHGGGMHGAGMHGGGMHDGGMHDGGTVDLEHLTGDAFDRAFLEEMIHHHRMGVHMAQMELRRGTDPEVRGLAQVMVDVQTREIQTMERWLDEWLGTSGMEAGAPPVSTNRPAPGPEPLHDGAAPGYGGGAGHHGGHGHGRG